MVAPLRFKGSNCFRQRLILSLLTGKSIIIDEIRPDGNGVQDYEESLLGLIQKLTNGTKVQIQASRIQFNPGSLIGGEVTHNCHVQRSISYYMEVLLSIAPFCKNNLQVTLNGVTNDQIDPNVDALKVSVIPILKKFIGDIEGTKLDIKINARGFKPEGGGQIVFTCPIVRQLHPVQMLDDGKVKRVRGVAVAARVSPQTANRMIEISKGLLLQFLPDVYIYSDHHKGKSSGLSPGFSLSLSAETTEGYIYTSSAVSNSKGSGDGPSIPEDVAKEATYQLYGEIQRGGCVDSICQSIVLTLMAFNQKDVSKVKLGPLTIYTIHFLRHLKEFCGLTFQLDSSVNPCVIATCQGIGYKNLSRSTRMFDLQGTNQKLSITADYLEAASEALQDIVSLSDKEDVRARQFEEKYTETRNKLAQYKDVIVDQDKKASKLKIRLGQEIMKRRGEVEILKSEIVSLGERLSEQELENDRLAHELRDKVKQYKLNLDDGNRTYANA